MSDGQLIVDEARRWLGVRWRHQGRSSQGVDCAGLCLCVGNALGAEIADSTGYPRRQDGTRLLAYLTDALQPVKKGAQAIGDIAVFNESGFPIHVGFLAEKESIPTVIHAHARRRKVIEEPLAVFGQPAAIFRLKEKI